MLLDYVDDLLVLVIVVANANETSIAWNSEIDDDDWLDAFEAIEANSGIVVNSIIENDYERINFDVQVVGINYLVVVVHEDNAYIGNRIVD